MTRVRLLLMLGASLSLWGVAAYGTPQLPHSLGSSIPQDSAASDDGDFEGDMPAPSIAAAPIAQPDIEGFGTLEQGHGGMPADIWQTSTRAGATALLQTFSTGIANPALRDLTMRLLMTQATPPPGTGPHWFLLRLQALITLGLDDKAEQMIASLPISMTGDTLQQLRAQLMVTRGDWDNACKLAPNAQDMHNEASQLFWRKLLIVCETRSGRKDEAMVGLDMLREESKQDDGFFQDVVHRLADKNAIIKSTPKEWSLFDAALLHLTQDTGLIKSHVDALPPVAVKYLAQDSTLDVKLREKATSRAIMLGILPQNEGNKIPEQPFERTLESDVITLVRALNSERPANGGDADVIARLAVGNEADIQDNRRVERLLSLMEPFGFTVPQTVWIKLFTRKGRWDGEVPPAMLVERLHDALTNNRKAEVILLSALILDGNEPSRVSDLALVPVVRALKLSGYEKEARQIAYSAVKDYH